MSDSPRDLAAADGGGAVAAPLELDADGLRAYLLGSLRYCGGAYADLGRRLPDALGWYTSLAIRVGARGIPFSWVVDIGSLLLEGARFRFASLTHLAEWGDEERRIRREYENRLLNGLLRDPSCARAIELIQQDPTRQDRIARTLELLLAPLIRAGGHADAPDVDPVLLRELAIHSRVDPAEQAAAYEALAGQGSLLAALESALQRTFAERTPGPALTPEDLAELEHWAAFRHPAQRLAARRVVHVAAGFPAVDPRGYVVSEAQEAETELPDAGTYPQGGFAELSTRGVIENLVPAELVYMGEDPFGEDPDPPVDLFSIRYVQGETLFFQRDSGQLLRTRRTVHLVVAPDQGLRLKLKWHPEPLIVLVYGLAVRLSEDLGAIFPADALRIELHLIAGPGPARERAEEDAELLRVLLRHDIAAGNAAVTVEGAAFDVRTLGERDRRVYGVAVQSGDRQPAGVPNTPAPPRRPGIRTPRLLTWRIGGEAPPPEAEDEVWLPLEGAPQGALVATRDALLGAIAGLDRGRGERRAKRRKRKGAAAKGPPQARDGSALEWVPPGRYLVGAAEANPERNALQPMRAIQLDRGVHLARHPVTWAQYRTFCDATGRTPPAPSFPVEGDHPVHGVGFAEAAAYADWAGARLPSEDEWECAARGPDGRAYPWGDAEPDLGSREPLLTCGRDPGGGDGATTAVGRNEAGASPFGCQDMAGNVWEWVAGDDPSGPIARGGCWNTPPWDCRTYARSVAPEPGPFVGFRIAKD